LQYLDPQYKVPRVHELLAKVFRQEDELGFQYRSHQVAAAQSASNRAGIEKWFQETGAKLQQGDRLIIYVTAHGGKSDDEKNSPGDTKLFLWNHEQIKMHELAAQLDKLPQGVSVALMMVQCYSGGFANVIFNEGKHDKGVSPHLRCGFFATIESRPAAGCTAEIDEEGYEEYSSYFWAALVGHRRTGQAIEKPDYDGDGRVTFDEAHAYAVLHSPTIDIPVKTSDALLRSASKLKDHEHADWLGGDTPYDELFKLASPAERAVLEGLCTELKLVQPERAKEAKELGDKVENERKQADEQRKNKYNAYNGIAGEIAKPLKNRWPELHNRWDPAVSRIMTEEAAAVVQQIESHPRWAELMKLEEEILSLDDKKLVLEKQWCKSQRLIRTLENVALAANLPKIAPEETQLRYQQLLAAERAGIGE
jgi:hypothetical protein